MGYGRLVKCSTLAMRLGKDNEKIIHRMSAENRVAEGEIMTVTCSGLHLMVDKVT